MNRKDATLKELCALIKQVNEDARKRTSTIEFTTWYLCFIIINHSFFNRQGKLLFHRLGSVCAAKPGKDDRATLASRKFQPGDHLCVVIRDKEY